ncbi:histone acethyltransferase-like protein [Theileria orientalis strain Shintoku]|uniref:tRNA carboxymethyluridine synthase n=1 Tax=Theileria orientalis strain Shintoku TaxID=869250 RepID=J4C7Y8_THEOR|nr:histone acethyltransferase-like protein [Theileria orientalis strain Shintoku]BAM39863.1 histone acethyltransferase-like protein [Theileria orientalis strain Shintoku]|eukprot:XP_009690164.1 histone acethyltransferase-like protein [Theileria orientalis strain Shintoku]
MASDSDFGNREFDTSTQPFDDSLDLNDKNIFNNEETTSNGEFKVDFIKDDLNVTRNGDSEAISEEWDSDSSEEMKNFFTATRDGFPKAAGEVKRVTRLDFEDYHRRRHLESFAKSMDQWKEFERKFEQKDGMTPQDFTFSRLNFDRYRDTYLNIDTKNLTKLDEFIVDLIESYYDKMENDDLNVIMSRLRRKHKLAPSKREIFERLESLQCVTLDEEEGKDISQEKLEENQVKDEERSVDKKYEEESSSSNRKVMVGSRLKHLLRNKAIRSNSGVVVITVMTSPGTFSCSEDCYYCPNEPGQPRSYLSTEPAVLRANQNDFDAVKQFYDRANTLYKNGHVVDKIEIIVLGGTWSGYPRSYQEEFVRDLFYAANIYPENLSKARERYSIELEHELNERSKCRIIGLTLETRPDRITAGEIELLRRYGCTRVQLGIQHTNNRILDYVNRGHSTEDSIRAIHLLKENCYKVDIHLMPDLPGSDPEEDKKMFKYVLSSEDLQADQWKIYPCEVTPFTEIEKWHKEGKYIPYFDVDANLLMNLLIKAKRAVHPWIRLNRVIRDIPNPSIIAGTNYTNMRQLILNKMKKLGLKCNCIRCREVKESGIGVPELVVREYETRGGTEYFLSYENEERTIIYGFLRLRVSARREYDESISKFRCLTGAGLIRELHVYGVVVAHGEKLDVNEPSQHRGIGTNLIIAAEIIAIYRGLWRMAIIAGIGTREYYKKHGYALEETFMTKKLSLEDIKQRYEGSKQRKIRVPDLIRVEQVNLENASIILEQPLPARKDHVSSYELMKNWEHEVNVSKVFEYAEHNEGVQHDYYKMNVIEELKLMATVAKRRVDRFMDENPLLTMSLCVGLSSMLLMAVGRSRRRK